MEEKKHQKHAKLTRPDFGHFGRREWAVIGTPCGRIELLAAGIIERLSSRCKIAYVDADHQSADNEVVPEGMRRYGAALEYTDKINFHRFDSGAQYDRYQFRQLFNEQDIVLVNGNHFPADRQIVVIDPKKEKSLERKLDRLTNVGMILLTAPDQKIYHFLMEHLRSTGQSGSIPVFHLEETDKIAEFIWDQHLQQLPRLKGLVLAGGKSQRMGTDKGAITYHGKPQRLYAADLLADFCSEVYISCRPDQTDSLGAAYPLLPDRFLGLGPFGAITTAFLADPNQAWLVVACDLPLLDEQAIRQLVDARNPSKFATAFQSPVNEFPEPLIAIWEPRCYPVLMQFLTQGYSCPRKVLINSDIALIDAIDPAALTNVNSPEEKEDVFRRLSSR